VHSEVRFAESASPSIYEVATATHRAAREAFVRDAPPCALARAHGSRHRGRGPNLHDATGMLLQLAPLLVVAMLAVLLVSSTLKIVKEYERAVVFRLGRLIPLRGPGLFFIFPLGIDRVTKVDLRVITLEVPA
jgi:hypothetical protein